MKRLLLLIPLLLSLAPRTHAARAFSGTNQYLQSASAVDLSGANKVSFSCYFYVSAFGNSAEQVVLEQSALWSNNAGAFSFVPDNNTGSMRVNFNSSDVGAFLTTRASFNRPSAGAWHAIACALDRSVSPNTVACSIDGVDTAPTGYAEQGTGTTGTFGNYTLNVGGRNGSSAFLTGRVAEVAIWKGVALTAFERNALSSGQSPVEVRLGARGVSYYWRLLGDASPEPGASLDGVATALAVTGATQVAHPRDSYN